MAAVLVLPGKAIVLTLIDPDVRSKADYRLLEPFSPSHRAVATRQCKQSHLSMLFLALINIRNTMISMAIAP